MITLKHFLPAEIRNNRYNSANSAKLDKNARPQEPQPRNRRHLKLSQAFQLDSAKLLSA